MTIESGSLFTSGIVFCRKRLCGWNQIYQKLKTPVIVRVPLFSFIPGSGLPESVPVLAGNID
jgi:hypothetical protein